MHRFNWKIALGVSLIVLSTVLYCAHFALFRDWHHIFIYLLGDVAFLPIEVLLVTLVIHQILTRREKRLLLQKLNMVIGAFFSEAGVRLLRCFIDVDRSLPPKCETLGAAAWRGDNLKALVRALKECEYGPAAAPADLERMKKLLADDVTVGMSITGALTPGGYGLSCLIPLQIAHEGLDRHQGTAQVVRDGIGEAVQFGGFGLQDTSCFAASADRDLRFEHDGAADGIRPAAFHQRSFGGVDPVCCQYSFGLVFKQPHGFLLTGVKGHLFYGRKRLDTSCAASIASTRRQRASARFSVIRF